MPGLVVAHMPNGTDLLEFDDRPTQPLRRGEALCVPAGVRHRFTVTSTGVSNSHWAHIQYTIFDSLDLMALLDPPTVLLGDGASRIGSSCTELRAVRDDTIPAWHLPPGRGRI